MRPCSEAPRPFASMRDLASIACCAAALLVLPLQILPLPTARAQQFDYDADANAWKIPQPSATKGEFKGDDPIGLASRQHIPTDCSITWTDDDGKFYCFASTMSSQIFQEERSSILPKAVAFWAKEHPKTPDISDGLPAAPPAR